jgi:cellulose synthase/poly-beta-1,6-N-acetylglucosamine synthase-like glycosyltransferase
MEDKNSRFDVNYKDDIKSVDTIDGSIDHKDYDHKAYNHKVYDHKVSICIPVYNNPNGLKKLLDSIRIQDYKDYEVIVSDDSDAGHAELCKEITLNYSEHMTIR